MARISRDGKPVSLGKNVSLDSIVKANLPVVCRAVGLVLVLCGVLHFVDLTPRSQLLGITCGLSGIVLLVYGWLLKRFDIAEKRTNALAFVVVVVVQINCFLPPATSPKVVHVLDAIYCTLGIGCLFLSRRWLAAGLTTTLILWHATTLPLHQNPGWLDVEFQLVTSVFVSISIFYCRRKSNLRLIRLKLESEQHRRDAERAREAQGAFLANMSHEIRTPMTAILGFTDLLIAEDDAKTPPSLQREALQTIRKNGQHLLSIINDLLDISQVEAGKLSIKSVPTSLRSLIEDVVLLMKNAAQEKGLKLSVVYENTIPDEIQIDPVRTKQILINLVGNALKFTSTGTVTIRLRSLNDESQGMEIDIVDTGIGMTPAQRQYVFDPFQQADSSTTREYGGNGLGLSISRHLARMLGGDLTIVDSNPGVGTCFRLLLHPELMKDSIRSALVEPRESNDTLMPPQTSESLKGMRILLAEDGPDNQRLFSFILKRAEASVHIAENGQLAVEAVEKASAEKKPFDVVLMDMHMPLLDGCEAAAMLRSKGYRGRIVALTANATRSDWDKCLAAGCDDYASKPISAGALIQVCRRNTPDDRKSLTALNSDAD